MRARTYNYLCVTYQGHEPPVTALTFLSFDSPFIYTLYQGWEVFPPDLTSMGAGGGGGHVYV
eukprot:14281867-Heterocapsa_arctica.AAC.1